MRTRAALLATLTATSLVAGGVMAGAAPRQSTAAGGFDVLDAFEPGEEGAKAICADL